MAFVLKLAALVLVVLSVSVACGQPEPTATPTRSSAADPEPLYTPSPRSIQVSLDESRAVTHRVPPAGGQVVAVGGDGTRYVLELPANALLVETEITMTPIASVEGAPVEGAEPLGVDLAPDGLELYEVATLTVEPAGIAQPTGLVALSYSGGGDEIHLAYVDPASGDVSIALVHFSGRLAYVSGGAGPKLSAPVNSMMPTAWEKQFEHWMAEQLQKQQVAGWTGEDDPEVIHKAIAEGIHRFYDAIVVALLPGIETDCNSFRLNQTKVLAWSKVVEFSGHRDQFQAQIDAVDNAVMAGAVNRWEALTKPCVSRSDSVKFELVVQIARINLFNGGDPEIYNPDRPELQCDCAEVADVQAWEGQVALRFEDSESEARSNATRTATEAHTFEVRFEAERPDTPPIVDANGNVTQRRYFGGWVGGQARMKGVVSTAGSETSVKGGAIRHGSVEIAVLPQQCRYRITVQVGVDAVHSSGMASSASGQIRIFHPMPATTDDAVRLHGSRSVPGHAGGPQPGPEDYNYSPSGHGVTSIVQMRGSQRLADAQVSWAFWPEGTEPRPAEELPESPFPWS